MNEFVEQKKKPLLALILLGEGTLTGAQVATALEVWTAKGAAGKHIPFGQIVLQLGLASFSQLSAAVTLQRKLASAPGEKKPLGLLMLESGAVTPTQIQHALDRQATDGGRLGELLVAAGALRKPQLDALLYFQKRAA